LRRQSTLVAHKKARFHFGRGFRHADHHRRRPGRQHQRRFWHLLPRNGKEHPLVRNNGVGSMVMIVILTLFIIGVAVMCEGLLG
jgi:hypothetical protein